MANNDDDELVRELFGDEFTDALEEKVEQKTDVEAEELSELQLRMAAVLECINKAYIDTEYILAKIDADLHPEVFAFIEDLHQGLDEVQRELSKDKYEDLQERDYEVR